MATKTLSENINQAISDFKGVKQAIIDKGVEIPSGTPTSEYGAKIGEIQSGGSGGLDTSGMTDFGYLCRNNRFNNQLDKLDTSQCTNFEYMFSDCTNLTTIPQLDTSKGTSFSNMFRGCSSLTTIPQIGTSRGTAFNGMFSGCTNLTTIPPLNTSKGTTFNGMFSGCKKLKTIKLTSFRSYSGMFTNCEALEELIVTGTITVSNNDLNLSYSPLLTVESLLSVLNALADNTGKTKYTITLGSTNLAKLTSTQKAIATNKNYTLK